MLAVINMQSLLEPCWEDVLLYWPRGEWEWTLIRWNEQTRSPVFRHGSSEGLRWGVRGADAGPVSDGQQCVWAFCCSDKPQGSLLRWQPGPIFLQIRFKVAHNTDGSEKDLCLLKATHNGSCLHFIKGDTSWALPHFLRLHKEANRHIINNLRTYIIECIPVDPKTSCYKDNIWQMVCQSFNLIPKSNDWVWNAKRCSDAINKYSC